MPDRTRKSSGSRPEFEIAYYTKELGRSLQRKLLEKQLARTSDPGPPASRHGEDASSQEDPVPPQDDSAG